MPRRGLLAAGGTLLAGAVAGNRRAVGGEAGGQAGAESGGVRPQALSMIAHESPHPVPALRFTDGAGAARPLTGFAGKGLVLNFWATWCVPCVAEMPALDALAPRLVAGGMLVLPVSLDRTGAPAVQAFYRSHAIGHLPVLLDQHSEAMSSLGLEGVPTTLLIDRQGREIGRIEGPVAWNEADAPAVLGRMLA